MAEAPKIICKNVWKIFGTYPNRTLENLDRSLSRAEVQAQTGHVIGVNDVSFDIKKGETFVVMGLSGSGKSTLVRCISRLIEPTAGEIFIDGENIITYSKAQLTELRRFRMSMVFQHFGLFPHRKVIDNISFGLEIRGMDKKVRKAKAMEVLEKVGLHGWADHYPRELSGGMQQRVGLARAMAVDPEILMFDEPFSALDPLIRREMQDELLNIQAEVQKTMMFITHDFLEAIKMGDRIAIMKDGVVVQIGTPEEIVTDPVDSYVREFTEDVPRYKVLSVGKVMRVASDAVLADGAERVNAHAKLDSLIDIATQCDGPLAVVDDENEIIGEIDQTMILKAMDSRS
ncbi:MAG: glycine betaine/L-proline ABC transporter ATP-binding protein [Gammaproteobacteria bacterium]|nr:glycine betaine/L-proline ABC transporter ATP-binding protein [Gammaproteobacteria bacterium]